MLISIGFNLIIFLVYVLVSMYQRYLYKKNKKWNISFEISIYILFYLLYTPIAYGFYLSPIIRGYYGFSEFFTKIIVNVFFILTPLLFFARRYAIKLIPEKTEKITIKGENKLDILKINQADLIGVSKSQNYIEIFYLDNNELKSKLIRSSLKNIQAEFDFLLQVHRSRLINPIHFKSWKDATTISLTQIDFPVSKNYKNQLLSL